MQRIPEIKINFYISKNDSEDFDRDNVTQQLKLSPTSTSQPRLSPGRVHTVTYEEAVEAMGDGITVLPSAEPPYPFLIHAYWSVVLPRMQTWSLEEPLREMEALLRERVDTVCSICDLYNLRLTLIITVYADANNMPIISIPRGSVSFWSIMKTEFKFDFYLD